MVYKTTCSICGQPKGRRRNSRYCKPCAAAYMRRWRADTKQRLAYERAELKRLRAKLGERHAGQGD